MNHEHVAGCLIEVDNEKMEWTQTCEICGERFIGKLSNRIDFLDSQLDKK